MTAKISLVALLLLAASGSFAAGKAVSIKDLLKDVGAADRAAFAGDLTLGEGRVLSASFAALKSLPESRLTEVKTAFAPRAEAKGKKTGKKGKMARLADLLNGVPKNVAGEFLDGLVFADGRVVGASTGGLKKAVTPERYKEILDSLAAPGTKPPAGIKGVCGNGWCDDSACVSRGSERRHCESSSDSTCYSSCK